MHALIKRPKKNRHLAGFQLTIGIPILPKKLPQIIIAMI